MKKSKAELMMEMGDFEVKKTEVITETFQSFSDLSTFINDVKQRYNYSVIFLL